MEREEKLKNGAIELREQEVATQLLEKERIKVDEIYQIHKEGTRPLYSLYIQVILSKDMLKGFSSFQAKCP